MKFGIFTNPAMPGVIADGKELAPIGRNNERYQELLDEMKRICFAAEELGFDSFSTTEHHFHSEGIEMSVAPLLLYTDLAARTKRIKFAPLALVLTTWDPIRAAEELAILDHLTKAPHDGRIRPRLPGPVGRRTGPEVSGEGDAVGQVRHQRTKQEAIRRELADRQGRVDPGGPQLSGRILRSPPSPTRTASGGGLWGRLPANGVHPAKWTTRVLSAAYPWYRSLTSYLIRQCSWPSH